MAHKTKEELIKQSDAAFPDNDAWLIDTADHRQFNNDLIGAMATEDWVKDQIASMDVGGNEFIACRRWHIDQANPKGEVYGNPDYIRQLPDLLGLGCYLVQDDLSMRKLNPANHYLFEDGSPAKLDGSDGQYMFCWKKHFFTEWEAGDYVYWAVTFNPIIGLNSQPVPAGGISAFMAGVMDRTSGKLCSLISDDPKYRGGNNQSEWDGTFRSQLGRPATLMTISKFQAAAKLRWKGWGAFYRVNNAVPKYLFSIIFGTRNSQSPYTSAKDGNGLFQGGLGEGFTNFPYGPEWGNYPILHTSAGVELGDNCGEATYEITRENLSKHVAKIPVFFGLKNLYGNLGNLISGELIHSSNLYITNSIDENPDYKSTDNMRIAATFSGNPRSGYISRLSTQFLSLFPQEFAGTKETYFCDHGEVVSSATLYGRFTGGYYSLDETAGAFYSYGRQSLEVGYQYLTAALCFLIEDE